MAAPAPAGATYTLECPQGSNEITLTQRLPNGQNRIIRQSLADIRSYTNIPLQQWNRNNFIVEQQTLNFLDSVKDGLDQAARTRRILNDLNIYPRALEACNTQDNLHIYEDILMNQVISNLSQTTWTKLHTLAANYRISVEKYLWESGLGGDNFIEHPGQAVQPGVAYDVNSTITFGSFIDPLNKPGTAWPPIGEIIHLTPSFMEGMGFGESSIEATTVGNNTYTYNMNIRCGDRCSPQAGCSLTGVDGVHNNPEYFTGNDTKNTFMNIAGHAAEKTKYMVIKEWGDKIQVIMYYMLNKINPSSVMSTCDIVVFALCIILGIRCVFTGKFHRQLKLPHTNLTAGEKSFYSIVDYLPGSPIDNTYDKLIQCINRNIAENARTIAGMVYLQNHPTTPISIQGDNDKKFSEEFYLRIAQDMRLIAFSLVVFRQTVENWKTEYDRVRGNSPNDAAGYVLFHKTPQDTLRDASAAADLALETVGRKLEAAVRARDEAAHRAEAIRAIADSRNPPSADDRQRVAEAQAAYTAASETAQGYEQAVQTTERILIRLREILGQLAQQGQMNVGAVAAVGAVAQVAANAQTTAINEEIAVMVLKQFMIEATDKCLLIPIMKKVTVGGRTSLRMSLGKSYTLHVNGRTKPSFQNVAGIRHDDTFYNIARRYILRSGGVRPRRPHPRREYLSQEVNRLFNESYHAPILFTELPHVFGENLENGGLSYTRIEKPVEIDLQRQLDASFNVSLDTYFRGRNQFMNPRVAQHYNALYETLYTLYIYEAERDGSASAEVTVDDIQGLVQRHAIEIPLFEELIIIQNQMTRHAIKRRTNTKRRKYETGGGRRTHKKLNKRRKTHKRNRKD